MYARRGVSHLLSLQLKRQIETATARDFYDRSTDVLSGELIDSHA